MAEMVDATLEQRIAALVEQHRVELEPLVDAALERTIAELVAERIHVHNENGAMRSAVVTSTETRVCVGPCGRELPVSAFEARRSKCRQCRRREVRERRAAAAADTAEPPRPE